MDTPPKGDRQKEIEEQIAAAEERNRQRDIEDVKLRQELAEAMAAVNAATGGEAIPPVTPPEPTADAPLPPMWPTDVPADAPSPFRKKSALFEAMRSDRAKRSFTPTPPIDISASDSPKKKGPSLMEKLKEKAKAAAPAVKRAADKAKELGAKAKNEVGKRVAARKAAEVTSTPVVTVGTPPAPSTTPKATPENKSKKEKAPAQKDPREEIRETIDNLKLEGVLPPEFKDLTDAQQLKVVKDLKRRVVDVVKSDAQTQYSEELKTRVRKGLGKKILGSIKDAVHKEKDLKNTEKKVFEALVGTPEGQAFIKDDLGVLVDKVKDQDIFFSLGRNKKGRAVGTEPSIRFVDETKMDSLTTEEIIKIDEFNKRANEFAGMSYERLQEKKGKVLGVKRRNQAKEQYEKARAEVLEIKARHGSRDLAMLELLEIDNSVKMEQLISTHPEFEKTLKNFNRQGDTTDTFKGTGKSVLFNPRRGKVSTNLALLIGGAGLRTGARLFAYTAGTGGLLTAPITGAVIGGIRGRIRGKALLIERERAARRGVKDASSEKARMVDVEFLTKGLDKMSSQLEAATTAEARGKILSKLKVVVEHSQKQIESGQVNFGNAKVSLNNQYNLVNSLNKALVLEQANSKTLDIDLKKRIDGFLDTANKDISGKIEKRQKEFIYKQTRNGALIGAGAASAGYTLRYLGEYMGWWGEQAKKAVEKGAVKTDASEGWLKSAQKWLDDKRKFLKGEAGEPPQPPKVPSSIMPKGYEHSVLDPNSYQASSDPIEKLPTQPDNVSRAVESLNVKTPNTTTPFNYEPEPGVRIGSGVTGGLETETLSVGKGNGGTQEVINMKSAIRNHYKGDYSNAPEGIKALMSTDDAKGQSIKFGLYNPNDPKESALLREGSNWKIDYKTGNVTYHDAKGEDTILVRGDGTAGDKYHGIMFDSDHSARASKAVAVEKAPTSEVDPNSRNTFSKTLQKDQYKFDETNTRENLDQTYGTPVETHVPASPPPETPPAPTPEELKARIESSYVDTPPRAEVRRHEIPGSVTVYNKPTMDEYGRRLIYDAQGNLIDRVPYGNPQGIGSLPPGQGTVNPYPYNDPRGGYPRGPAPMPRGLGLEQATPAEQAVVAAHPEFFKDNPYNLDISTRVEVYETYKKTVEGIFPGDKLGNTMDKWLDIKELPATKVVGAAGGGSEENDPLLKVANHLKKLQDLTGSKPEGRGIFGIKKVETVEHYMIRAMQRAAQIPGALDKLK